MNVDVDHLHPSPMNLRSDLGDLGELEASIAAIGILNPLVVRRIDGQLEVVAGHRRLQAAKNLGLAQVPVIVRDFTDSDAVAAMLVENLQRDDLDPFDEASGYGQLIDLGWTQRQIASQIGRSYGHVSKRLALLDLSAEIVAEVRTGTLTLEDAYAATTRVSPKRAGRKYNYGRQLVHLAKNAEALARRIRSVARTWHDPSDLTRAASWIDESTAHLKAAEQLLLEAGTSLRDAEDPEATLARRAAS